MYLDLRNELSKAAATGRATSVLRSRVKDKNTGSYCMNPVDQGHQGHKSISFVERECHREREMRGPRICISKERLGALSQKTGIELKGFRKSSSKEVRAARRVSAFK